MQMSRLLAPALVALLGTQSLPTAIAAPCSLPATAGWSQLQRADTYETVWTSSDGACDVEPGRYTLIDFGVSPASRTPVTVRGGAGPAGAIFQRVTRTEAFVNATFELASLAVACPVGTVAISGDCGAIVTSAEGGALPIPGQWEGVGDTRGNCAFIDAPTVIENVRIRTLCADASLVVR